MAWKNCAECGKPLSNKDPTCPHCGAAATSGTQSGKPVDTAPRKHLSPRKLVTIVVLIGLECLLFWRWGANNSDKAVPAAAALAAPTSPPEKVVHERNQLQEGQSAAYSFTLNSDARVHLEVTATPKPVDVLLMSSDEAIKFRESQKKVFGGDYAYRQTLSALHILTMDKTDILPQGNWVIVVVRPQETILFRKDTAASMILTIY